MNNDDIELTFAKDEVKEGYKLGKILATSAMVSDAPLGAVKLKRTKLKLFILALILGYPGFAVYSDRADATLSSGNRLQLKVAIANLARIVGAAQYPKRKRHLSVAIG